MNKQPKRPIFVAPPPPWRVMPVIFAKQMLLAYALEHIGRLSICTSGYSMLPAIESNTWITIRKPQKCTPGDVILFTHDQGHLILHRIIYISANDLIYCKGDNELDIQVIHSSRVIALADFSANTFIGVSECLWTKTTTGNLYLQISCGKVFDWILSR